MRTNGMFAPESFTWPLNKFSTLRTLNISRGLLFFTHSCVCESEREGEWERQKVKAFDSMSIQLCEYSCAVITPRNIRSESKRLIAAFLLLFIVDLASLNIPRALYHSNKSAKLQYTRQNLWRWKLFHWIHRGCKRIELRMSRRFIQSEPAIFNPYH